MRIAASVEGVLHAVASVAARLRTWVAIVWAVGGADAAAIDCGVEAGVVTAEVQGAGVSVVAVAVHVAAEGIEARSALALLSGTAGGHDTWVC